ncbi:uncharacterized protein V1518DRAFT_49779 [Limtongia smithiae]|uniref:uncharacterized protein n=1 Tax=Limtongia smithiae TaxID=1125753 RepID=UPI0034CD7CD6
MASAPDDPPPPPLLPASVLLIGIRGVGKSTLALIAAQCLAARFVDTDAHVHAALGTSPLAYIREHSLQEYRACEHEVLRALLAQASDPANRCVVAVGAAVLEHKPNQQLICEFRDAGPNPVVHVVCDINRIVEYYSGATDVAMVLQMCAAAIAVFRRCANYEFFNLLSEGRVSTVSPYSKHSQPRSTTTSTTLSSGDSTKQLSGLSSRALSARAPRPFLLLKNSERDFVHFLRTVLGLDTTGTLLSRVPPPELRKYTYSVSFRFPLDITVHSQSRMEDLVLGADCVEIVVSMPRFRDSGLLLESIAQYYSTVRRYTTLPIMYSIATGPLTELLDESNFSLYLTLLDYGRRLAPEYFNISLNHLFTKGEDGFRDTTLASRLVEAIHGHGEHSLVSKIVGSWHQDAHPGIEPDMWWSSTEPKHILENAIRLQCRVARISKEATSSEDNSQALAFVENYTRHAAEHGCHLSAFNTGHAGRLSQIFNPILTPVVAHYAADSTLLDPLNVPLSGLPREVSAYGAQKVLHSAFALPTLRFYIFGNDIAKSISPLVHNSAFQAMGLPHAQMYYQTDNPGNIAQLARSIGLGGIAVTTPHKQRAAMLVDSLSVEAQIIGAVNTIVAEHSVNATQKVRGENTDWVAVYKSIAAHLSPVNAVSHRTTALVIGAGASARATVYALVQLGVENIIIYNRTLEHAVAVAEYFNKQSLIMRPYSSQDLLSMVNTGTFAGRASNSRQHSPSPPQQHRQSPTAEGSIKSRRFHIHVLRTLDDAPEQLKESGLEMPTIIVSAVPVHVDFPSAWLQSPTGGVVLELFYSDLNSPILRRVRAVQDRGWIAVDGLMVLPELLCLQFELWTNKPAARGIVAQSVTRYYEDHI